MTEDLEPRIVGGPPRYTSRTAKPVQHIALATADGQLIGYLYANDEDDAAGWVAVAGLNPAGWNLATPWIRMLHEAKERGLKPTAALEEIQRAPNPYTRVVPGSRSTSASLAILKEVAGHQQGES